MNKFISALRRLIDPPQWRDIESAPPDRELELAIINGEIRPLGGFCLRHGNEWFDAETLKPISVAATHWRFRWPIIFPVNCC